MKLNLISEKLNSNDKNNIKISLIIFLISVIAVTYFMKNKDSNLTLKSNFYEKPSVYPKIHEKRSRIETYKKARSHLCNINNFDKEACDKNVPKLEDSDNLYNEMMKIANEINDLKHNY